MDVGMTAYVEIALVPTGSVGMQSRRAHRYTQVFTVDRHSGRDCRNPEHRDVNG